jgi:hypothetical protein
MMDLLGKTDQGPYLCGDIEAKSHMPTFKRLDTPLFKQIYHSNCSTNHAVSHKDAEPASEGARRRKRDEEHYHSSECAKMEWKLTLAAVVAARQATPNVPYLELDPRCDIQVITLQCHDREPFSRGAYLIQRFTKIYKGGI